MNITVKHITRNIKVEVSTPNITVKRPISNINVTQVGRRGPQGEPGEKGEDGADGAAGPNLVSTDTSTDITGLLKGDGSKIVQAAAGTDYAAANHDHDADYADINHDHALTDLSDVTITSPQQDQVLKYNGSAWVNDTDATSSGGGGVTDHGALTGLNDDDHTQYALADGSRGSFATTAQGAKADTAVQPSDLADVATSGDYDDLDNKPSLFDGDYNSLSNKPTIPTNNNQLTNGAGYITGYTVTEGDVTTHQAALAITESQITDLGDYAEKQSRDTEVVTTGSLAPNAAENTTADLAIGYRLLRVQTDIPARVQVYASSAQRTADEERAVGTDPTGNHGVILDVVTTDEFLTLDLSPQVDGSSLESIPSASIPIRVTNLDDGTGTVTVTFTWIATEVA